MRPSTRGHTATGATAALIGVVATSFLNRNVRLSPWAHLLLDVPEASLGRLLPLVSMLGIAFALIDGRFGRQELRDDVRLHEYLWLEA